jgi:regulator of nucleoside diphosphate kinase
MNTHTTGPAGVRPSIVITTTDHARLTALAGRASGDTADYLAEELSRAQIVADIDCAPHIVRMGSRVTYHDDGTGERRTVTLVYPAEADINLNRVSVLTPIGAALIGMSPTRSIVWSSPVHGDRTLTVVDVSNAD